MGSGFRRAHSDNPGFRATWFGAFDFGLRLVGQWVSALTSRQGRARIVTERRRDEDGDSDGNVQCDIDSQNSMAPTILTGLFRPVFPSRLPRIILKQPRPPTVNCLRRVQHTGRDAV